MNWLPLQAQKNDERQKQGGPSVPRVLVQSALRPREPSHCGGHARGEVEGVLCEGDGQARLRVGKFAVNELRPDEDRCSEPPPAGGLAQALSGGFFLFFAETPSAPQPLREGIK